MLGNFSMIIQGSVCCSTEDGLIWVFTGSIRLLDFNDYDPHVWSYVNGSSSRSWFGELAVLWASIALPGISYKIDSVEIPISQKGNGKFIW